MGEKQTKRMKFQDDDDDKKHENSHDHDSSDDDSSSTHNNKKKKKGKIIWSQELHEKFVLAVNQLSIDKAMPRKILDLMKVENLTRENVASHLQKYRLHLKKKANMVAASGNANPSPMRIGSLSSVGGFQTLSGSENFHHNNAFGTFPTALNDPASQDVYEFHDPAQHFNSTNNNDQLKLKSAILGQVYPNSVQALPISKQCYNKFPDSLTEIHSQGVFSDSTSNQVNNNMPFQQWEDENQDASHFYNVIDSSINSLTAMNGAAGPKYHDTSTNLTFNNGNLDFYFGDPVQMKHDIWNSVELQQVHTINQQKCQKSCVTDNVKSIEELITASSSGSSQESVEIAELRKEIAAARYEHQKLIEMIVQQDKLMQAILPFVRARCISSHSPH